MASRKIESSKSKGKYIPSHKSKRDLNYALSFEVGPPVASQRCNLEDLLADGPSTPQSVPKFDGVGVAPGPGPGDNGPPQGGMKKRHKDLLLTNEFVTPIDALKQPQIPHTVVWEKLVVTWADGPRNFYVAVNDELSNQDFNDLERGMDTFYNKFHEKYEDLPFDELKEQGHYVVRRVVSGSGEAKWYRCQILQLITRSDNVIARLLDYGETIRAKPNEFRRIKQTFAKLPILVYQVSLKPLDSTRDKDFTPDCERFKNEVDGREFSGLIYAHSCDTGDLKKFQVDLAGENPETREFEFLADQYQ